jgi:inosine/xanthosine triphosphate pyrophosphatase family protein
MKVDGVSKLNHSVYSIINAMFPCHICMMVQMDTLSLLIGNCFGKVFNSKVEGKGGNGFCFLRIFRIFSALLNDLSLNGLSALVVRRTVQ